jgi:hypothetical protein
MKSTAFLLLILISFSGISNNLFDAKANNIFAEKGISDSPVKVKVKLAEFAVLPSFCGVFKWEKTYRFELLDSAGFAVFPRKFILIKFTCPREMGAGFFQKGKTYYFFIQKEINFTRTEFAKKENKDSLPVYLYRGNTKAHNISAVQPGSS